MTKRIISLVLVCILAIPILAVPASATSGGVTSSQFDMFATSLGNLLNYWGDELYTVLSGLRTNMNDWHEAMNSNMVNYLGPIKNDIALIKTQVLAWLQTINDNLVKYLNPINNTVSSIKTNMVAWFETLNSNMNSHLSQIKTKLDSLLNGEPGAADDFNNQVSTDATEFEENMNVIQDVTRPNIEDIELDIDKEIPEGEVVKVGQLLGIFFQNQYIYIVFFIAFTFSLVSYGIFGKR